MSQQFQHDVLVIGSGAAGLSLALTLPAHLRIAVLSKGDLANGSTFWAQGGVAAVLDDTDTIESHVEDTLNAGGGLCNPKSGAFHRGTQQGSHPVADRSGCTVYP